MPEPERQRSEPEIIPPGRAGQGATPRERIDTQGTERIYVTRIRPLSGILAMLLTGAVLAVMLALFFGAMLIWLSLLIAFVVGALIAGFLRAYFRRAPRG